VSGSDIAVDDVDERCPDYTVATKTAGIRAVAGIPMLAKGAAIGAVNLYASQPRTWAS